MSNIIDFPQPDDGQVPIADVLANPTVQNAQRLLIVGVAEDGEIFISLSDNLVAENLVLCELARRAFMRCLEDHHGIDA